MVRLLSLLAALMICNASLALAGQLTEEQIASRVVAPMALGEKDPDLPIWEVLNGAGAPAGYAFETIDLIQLPGFSGTPVNLFVIMDREGRLLEVSLIDQNEPVFVSGLGVRPLHRFLRQYHGLSVGTSIKVASTLLKSDSGSSAHVVIDGVAKATASVRIANETIMAASLQVARERLAGIAARPAGKPRVDLIENHDVDALIEMGLISRRLILNRDVEAAFAGSDLEGADEAVLAKPDAPYLELFVADLGIPTVAHSLLTAAGRQAAFQSLQPTEEPILVMARGSASLTGPDFVRNATPAWLSIEQDGLPVNLRDADVPVDIKPAVGFFDEAMVLRVDRRLGFDPAGDWSFVYAVERLKGIVYPERGLRPFNVAYRPPARFFEKPEERVEEAPWVASWRAQQLPLLSLSVFLGLLCLVLVKRDAVSASVWFPYLRAGILAVTLVWVGWIAQAQLSIVTVLGAVKTLLAGSSLVFLLYDPMSLVLWAFVLVSLIVWGRGTFCGWLCPFGVLQEAMARIATWTKIPQIKVSGAWDRRLMTVKYGVLTGLVLVVLIRPDQVETAAEVEPFKTAITLGFDRAWPFLVYAAGLLVAGLFLHKAFCRYLCPLGALLALMAGVRRFGWIARRADCGSPCQLCKVRCAYGAIEQTGDVRYSECFQCLDCVTIYQDPQTCVPLVQAGKRNVREAAE
ncbi:MAG: 4Fe-4S binding protein [Magnetovibrionaceae bacterium]